jgi:hypothetical protein
MSMRIYKVEATTLGINDKPEIHCERIIADGWQEVHELMARISRDTGCVIVEIKINETNEAPLDFRTVKAS